MKEKNIPIFIYNPPLLRNDQFENKKIPPPLTK
eukprot:UN04702